MRMRNVNVSQSAANSKGNASSAKHVYVSKSIQISQNATGPSLFSHLLPIMRAVHSRNQGEWILHGIGNRPPK
jgi:hypothetical protein